MKIEKFNAYENYEDKNRAEKYIMSILNCADFFEYRTQIKPTVFMSNDVLSVIAGYHRETITRQIYGEPLKICGYDLKMVYGEKILYLGISTLVEPMERGQL